jgi:predicted PurR-regulated permease PerM
VCIDKMKLRGSRGARWAAVFFPLAALVLAIAALRFAGSLLIPIGIAVLLAFLLTPLVRHVEALGAPASARSGWR